MAGMPPMEDVNQTLASFNDLLQIFCVAFLLFLILIPLGILIMRHIFSASVLLNPTSPCSANSGSKMKQPPSP